METTPLEEVDPIKEIYFNDNLDSSELSESSDTDYIVETESIQSSDENEIAKNTTSLNNESNSNLSPTITMDKSLPIPEISIREFYLSRDYTKEGYCIFIVDNPLKKKSMLKTKVTYRIFCHTTLETFPCNEFYVRRSFSDAKWLRSYLRWKYPYCIIPPLPNTKKLTQKGSSTALINSRRRSIQRFLNRIGSHSILAESKIVYLFLTGDGDAFKEIKKFYEEKRKTKKSKRLQTKSYGNVFSSLPPPISKEDEDMLNKIKLYKKEISELIESFRSLHKSADEVIEGKKTNTSKLKSFVKQFAKFNTLTQLRYPTSKIDASNLINTLVSFQQVFDKLRLDEVKLMEFDVEGLHELIKDWTRYFKEAADFIARYHKMRLRYAETEITLEELKKKEQKKELESPKLTATQQWLNDEEDNGLQVDDYSDVSVTTSPEDRERILALTKQLKKDKEKVDLFIEHFERERREFDNFRMKEMMHWTKYYANFQIMIYKKMISQWESYVDEIQKSI